MKKDLTKHIDFLKNRIAALEQVKNSISEEARAEIEGRIGQLRELASDLEAIRDANAEGEEDHSAEMLAQMREVLARVEAVEDAVKTEREIHPCSPRPAFYIHHTNIIIQTYLLLAIQLLLKAAYTDSGQFIHFFQFISFSKNTPKRQSKTILRYLITSKIRPLGELCNLQAYYYKPERV